MKTNNLFDVAAYCLSAANPDEKVALTANAARQWCVGKLDLQKSAELKIFDEPGRPKLPRLVLPQKLPHRSLATPEGHAALIHSIAHIEFNAINLAWDAVYRFREMPRKYYDDWVRVADEEAYHFSLLRDHLKSLGYNYGDFDAHNGLWEMAQKTSHDVLERMALVPRVLEARGLDVTPGIIKRLSSHGDHEGVMILEIILRDEIGHVEIGSRWFRYLCEQRELEPKQTFQRLFSQYMHYPARGSAKGGLHRKARLAAGFSEEELNYLEGVG